MYKRHKEKHNKFNFIYIFKFMDGKKNLWTNGNPGKKGTQYLRQRANFLKSTILEIWFKKVETGF